MDICPYAAKLDRLTPAEIDDPVDPTLDRHIEGCELCQAALDRRVHEGTEPDGRRAAQRLGTGQRPEVPGFVVEDELGRGGMGVVYRARQLDVDRPVALKFLTYSPEIDPRDRARWLREARAGGRVRHPNVVQFFQAAEADGWLYLVLEYVPGGSLQDRLTGPLADRVAARLLETIARAVEQVHREDLLHLDLKPSNILLVEPPETPLERATPKVTDFGIARPGEDPGSGLTSLAGPLGTPSYMAPEQADADRRAIGPRTDVFALGAILYQMLTGRPPFLAKTTIKTLDQVRTQEPVPPRRLIPGIDRDLETICLQCLRKDPRRRYPSAGALADDLANWLGRRPIAARPVPAYERAWLACRRRPAIASLVATLAATVVIGIVILLGLLGQAQADRALAEAARRRAEGNERIASRALGEVCESIATILDNRPDVINFSLSKRIIDYDNMTDFADSLRRQIRDLRGRSEVAVGILAAQATLDRRLAERLAEKSGWTPEAIGLLDESVALLEECLGRRPDDKNLLFDLIICYSHMIDLGKLGHASARVISVRRRVRDLMGDSGVAPRILDALAVLDRRLAARLGRTPEAIGLLEESVALLEECLERKSSGKVDINYISDLLISSLADLARIGGERGEFERAMSHVDRATSFIGGLGSDKSRAEWLSKLRAEWLSVTALRRAADGGDLFSERGESELRAWAASLVTSIQAKCAARGVGESAVPSGYIRLVNMLEGAGAAKRKDDKLDEALGVEGRLMSLARELVRRYPDQTASHMILARAFQQSAKNAWHRSEPAAAIQALREARDAARRASSFDPQREDVRMFLDDIEERLASALAEESTPG